MKGQLLIEQVLYIIGIIIFISGSILIYYNSLQDVNYKINTLYENYYQKLLQLHQYKYLSNCLYCYVE